MGVHDGHRERMRERFRGHGLDNFNDINALELLLFYAAPRRDTNGMAHALLEKFGSLSAVLEANEQELLTVPGIGENAVTLLRLIPAFSRRYLLDKTPSDEPVDSAAAALECALYKKPMVVGYKMPALTGMIMQKKALIHCVSLPNILLGENVVPEFLQFFCEPDPISYALEDALQNEARRRMLEERFSAMHESLIADTPALAADVIMSVARS